MKFLPNINYIKIILTRSIQLQKSDFRAPLSPKRRFFLRVYDVLGNEIALLFPPLGRIGGATYEVEWNASNHSSGVYYYKLAAKDYSKRRKWF
jgi:hypothetical protein